MSAAFRRGGMAGLVALCGLFAAFPPAPRLSAQGATPDAALLTELRWRNIGPHRASRTKALDGVPSRRTPSTSAWSTAASGRRPTPAGPGYRSLMISRPARSVRWRSRPPIPTSSTSAAAKGSSVRTFRPATACTSRLTRAKPGRISACATRNKSPGRRRPDEPESVFVAALGHPYGPNDERGIFRSADGGRNFERVLYKDENTGGADVLIDPANPSSSTPRFGRHARGRGRTATSADRAAASSSRLTAARRGGSSRGGLPTWEADRLGRIGIGIAPSRPSRLFLVVEARSQGGIYR